MYTSWENGGVLPTDWQEELCEVFELPPAALGFVRGDVPGLSAEILDVFDVL